MVALRLRNPAILDSRAIPVFSSVSEAEKYTAKLNSLGYDIRGSRKRENSHQCLPYQEVTESDINSSSRELELIKIIRTSILWGTLF